MGHNTLHSINIVQPAIDADKFHFQAYFFQDVLMDIKNA